MTEPEMIEVIYFKKIQLQFYYVDLHYVESMKSLLLYFHVS